ncbi:DUF2306 domain-containing protein [Amycolatopsis sp. FDAARGOS 1241]|uniref:DUF2306 domain-containing protein n=1 Tax=Amycolatopsis sp. FDAARGOS 1241 TaxID=2778070 RepID=UPI00194F2B6C|nr:DUF2306 domain-containing protein [Amycolatopsis sp. FDAARGOS 1241]QRP46863.1 DUF2306 domain-containing protein [Amycolatopsis sp. FDAARGOS 1241]
MTATDLQPPRVEHPPAGRPRRKRRPWIGVLGLVVVAFLAYSLPPYLSLDPAQSRVPAPAGFGAHYWFLVGHVVFGSIAMLCAVVQIWPWVRRRFSVLHRYAGRGYVFGGVLPSGVMALTIGAASPFGPATRASDVLLAVVWIGTTWAGFRAARERRFADHRRWMVRSFALTMSIILNRLISPLAIILLEPQVPTTFGGSQVAFMQSVAAIAAWASWTLALIGAQLWLDRKPRRVTA